MEGLRQAFSNMGKTLIEIRQKDSNPDKTIPNSFILPNPPISILSLVYKPSEIVIQKSFPHHFPEEERLESSSRDHYSLVIVQNPSYENLPHHTSRPSAPDLMGKGRFPETQTFVEHWFQEWNIDSLSVAQIRQMIDRMYVSYKIMCMKGKIEIEACKSIIQCFTDTLSKWWEVISSPVMIAKVEDEVLNYCPKVDVCNYCPLVIPPLQDRYRYYYCMIKFSVQFITFPEPDWLADWWKKFGLHLSGIHPDVTETSRMFLFPNRNLQLSKSLF
jgi:hypothetical protein